MWSKLPCIVILLFVLSFNTKYSEAQCNADSSHLFAFNNPGGLGYYNGYLCGNIDSVGTLGNYGYYDGDAYAIRLVAGSQIIFSVDSCSGNPVSLTVNDSAHSIIPGAFAAAACPNQLNFTAAYTGLYYLVINKNGACGNFGLSLIGEAYAKIATGTSVPACPNANLTNDTICGAIPLVIDSFFQGNSLQASPTDPLDAYVVSIGDSCSQPNNTLWYSYTSPINLDSIHIWLTSGIGSNFHSWLIGFIANNASDPCHGGLTFLGCANGPDDMNGVDTTNITIYGIQAGEVYYFMIDGFNNQAGPFSLAIKTLPYLSTAVNEFEPTINLLVSPNPASEYVILNSTSDEQTEITITDCSGRILKSLSFRDMLDHQIDIHEFSNGLYFFGISTSKGTSFKKVLIHR